MACPPACNCATHYREDLCLAAGEIVERAVPFSALERLVGSGA